MRKSLGDIRRSYETNHAQLQLSLLNTMLSFPDEEKCSATYKEAFAATIKYMDFHEKFIGYFDALIVSQNLADISSAIEESLQELEVSKAFVTSNAEVYQILIDTLNKSVHNIQRWSEDVAQKSDFEIQEDYKGTIKELQKMLEGFYHTLYVTFKDHNQGEPYQPMLMSKDSLDYKISSTLSKLMQCSDDLANLITIERAIKKVNNIKPELVASFNGLEKKLLQVLRDDLEDEDITEDFGNSVARVLQYQVPVVAAGVGVSLFESPSSSQEAAKEPAAGAAVSAVSPPSRGV